jgi:hypothetical protein
MACSESFLFIVSSDTATFKGPSIQSRIRKHASRSACKSRRAKFVLERHNPRQLPPVTGLYSSEAAAANPVVLEKSQVSASNSPEDLTLEETTETKVAKPFAAVASRPELVSSVSTEHLLDF